MENGFIYIIKNCINDKVYIGQTTQDYKDRFKQHCKLLKSNKNQLIHKAIKKYGKENFYIEVLEECCIEKLNELEEFYILKFNSFGDGYNLCAGGNQARRLGIILPKIEVTDLYQYGFSHREIAAFYSTPHSVVSAFFKKNNIKSRLKSHSLIKYSKISEEQLKELLIDGLSFKDIAKKLKVNRKSISKAIQRYNLQNIIIKK